MLRKDEHVFGYVMRGYWSDLGTRARYREAVERFRRGRVRLSYIRE